MKKKTMKTIAGICALSLVLSGMSMPVQAMNDQTTASIVVTAEESVPTEGTCGENLTWRLTEDGILEITGTGAMEEWTSEEDCPWYSLRDSVLKVVVGAGVTSIAEKAFYSCYHLTEVSLPEGLETMSECAFAFCTSLTRVTLPSTLKEFSWSHFIGCSALKEISVSEENAEYLAIDGILYDKEAKTLIYIPEAYDKTPVYTIPETVTNIKANSISRCTGLKEIVIHKDIRFFPSFSGCTNLEKITVAEENAKYVSVDGVMYTKDLTELIKCPAKCADGVFTIPDGVEVIGYDAFDNCDGMTEVVFPDSVTEIDDYAFEECDSLTEIVFPERISKIGSYAVGTLNYNAVKHITILNPTCEIYDSPYNFGFHPVIYGYTGSTAEAYAAESDLEFHSLGYAETVTTTPTTTTTTTTTEITTTTTVTSTSASETTTETTTSLVLTGPEGMLTTTTTTTTADNWEDEDSGKFGDFYYTIQLDGTISIEYTGTDACVEIPAEINGRKVAVIAAEAFRYNENVEHVVIPEGVTEIQPGAFMECSNLKSVVVPESVSEIKDNTFLGCDSLEMLTIENYDCIIHMESYTLPENITIRCKAGSTAEDFALAFGYQVEILSSIALTEEEIGDVSTDGVIGIDDATLVLTYYAQNAAGLNPNFNEDTTVNERLCAAADIDEDAQIAISDATMVLTYYAQNAAGLNPTWESLRSS